MALEHRNAMCKPRGCRGEASARVRAAVGSRHASPLHQLKVVSAKSYRAAASEDRCGRTLPAESRNQPRKMYHAALAWLSPGIGSSIGSADNTPTIARHPAMTNRAILGARRTMENLSRQLDTRHVTGPLRSLGPAPFIK